MRTLVASFVVIGILVATLTLPSKVAAKTSITISPESGPPGTTVRIEGFGFPLQEKVDIAFIASGRLSTNPRDEYGLILRDGTQLSSTLHLASVTPAEETTFITSVSLPSLQEVKEVLGSDDTGFEIIATTPTDGGGIFVARAYFTMTGTVAQGTNGSLFSGSSVSLSAAGLAVVTTAILAIGWRIRTTRRHLGGPNHGHASHRGPAGP